MILSPGVCGGESVCQQGPACPSGWMRHYHGYLFTDFRDGALFGPKGSQAIDMMRMVSLYASYKHLCAPWLVAAPLVG
jgi:hypothetical protein